jgi:hypothetical protein
MEILVTASIGLMYNKHSFILQVIVDNEEVGRHDYFLEISAANAYAISQECKIEMEKVDG